MREDAARAIRRGDLAGELVCAACGELCRPGVGKGAMSGVYWNGCRCDALPIARTAAALERIADALERIDRSGIVTIQGGEVGG